jgi:hypothetical protein
MLTQVSGSPPPVVAFPLAIASMIAPATVSPATQPIANAIPFARARGVPSISTMAMIGTGLMATPIASGRVSPIAWAHSR